MGSPKSCRKRLEFFAEVIAPSFSEILIINLENQKLRELKKRNESTFAQAYDVFFSDPLIPNLLRASQITTAVARFFLCANTRQEFIVIPRPGKECQKIIARRLCFCQIMDFLQLSTLAVFSCAAPGRVKGLPVRCSWFPKATPAPALTVLQADRLG